MGHDVRAVVLAFDEVVEMCREAGYSPFECARFITKVLDAETEAEVKAMAHELEQRVEESTKHRFESFGETVVCEVCGVKLTLRDVVVACAACDKHLEDEKEGWRADMLRDACDKLFEIATKSGL